MEAGGYFALAAGICFKPEQQMVFREKKVD